MYTCTFIKWFHYLVYDQYGAFIQVSNIPLPPDGTNYTSYKYAKVMTSQSTQNPEHSFTTILVNVYLGLGAVMLLTTGYLIYKRYGRNLATSLGFQMLPSTSVDVPINVLMVYPPENETFQRAVIALAEFLQKHAGCSVAIDVWQQNKIAHDGPMCWLAEQVKIVKRVLIVCPMSRQPPAIPNFTPTGGPSIPAAAQDLYPLILNVVASHAKSSRELAKFWVVQLGEQQKISSNLAPELRTCKVFCLLKDLNKLCGSLHTQDQVGKRLPLVFRPGTINHRKSTRG
nr:interleukin-17 receptor B-like [Nerophis lumbriciformis]